MTNKKKALKDLNLEDDFLFAKVMSDMEICRKVLEKILNVPIRKVTTPTTQKALTYFMIAKASAWMYMSTMIKEPFIM